MVANGQLLALVNIPPGKRPQYSLNRWLSRPQRPSGYLEDKHLLPLPEYEPQIAQPHPSHYTAWAIRFLGHTVRSHKGLRWVSCWLCDASRSLGRVYRVWHLLECDSADSCWKVQEPQRNLVRQSSGSQKGVCVVESALKSLGSCLTANHILYVFYIEIVFVQATRNAFW